MIVALLPSFPAQGTDGAAAKLVRRPTNELQLPPIPELELAPWLDWVPMRDGLKIDTLQLPRSPLDRPTPGDRYGLHGPDLPTS